MIHLILQAGGAPEGTFDGAPKDALSDLHKDAKEGAFEVALKGALVDATIYAQMQTKWSI